MKQKTFSDLEVEAEQQWENLQRRAPMAQNPIIYLNQQGRVVITNFEARLVVVKNPHDEVISSKEYSNSMDFLPSDINAEGDKLRLDLPKEFSFLSDKEGWYDIVFTKFDGNQYVRRVFVSLREKTVFNFHFKKDPTSYELNEGRKLNKYYLDSQIKADGDKSKIHARSTIKKVRRIPIAGHPQEFGIELSNVEAISIRAVVNDHYYPHDVGKYIYNDPLFQKPGTTPVYDSNALLTQLMIDYTGPGFYKFIVVLINNDIIEIENYFD